MNGLLYKGYTATLEVDIQDCCINGVIDGIPSKITFKAERINEIRECFINAVEEYLDECREKEIQPVKPCSGNVQFRVSRSLHAAAIKVAQREYPSFNKFGEAILRAAVQKDFPEL